MSGAVDNQLLHDESSEFHHHIEICGSCRDEYELEKLTKAYLRKKMTFVDVPYDVERAIVAQFSSEAKSESSPSEEEKSGGFISRLFRNNLFQPILAVGMVAVIGIILFFANKPNVILPVAQEPVEVASTQQDALSLAETNFQDVLSGKFKPEVTAIATPEVSSYINQNAGYTMQLPAVASADWVGGLVSDFGGNKMAQVVYKMGDDYIYICSFPKIALQSKKISFPTTCSKAIADNGWFWAENSDGDIQAAWGNSDHVCIATSNLERSDLAAYLKPPVNSDEDGH
jgi:hypothetical protein